MNPSTIDIVKATIPVLEASGVEITQHFYALLLSENPELKHIFNLANQATGRQ